MIIAIYVILGIILMFPKSIGVSSALEIRRPRTFVFGLIVIGSAILAKILSGVFAGPLDSYGNSVYTTSWLIAYIAPLLVPFITVFFLKQPRSSSQMVNPNDKKY